MYYAVLFNQGKLAEAIQDVYDEAIRLNPEYSQAYCNRGGAYGGTGEFDKAVADCTEARSSGVDRHTGCRQ